MKLIQLPFEHMCSKKSTSDTALVVPTGDATGGPPSITWTECNEGSCRMGVRSGRPRWTKLYLILFFLFGTCFISLTSFAKDVLPNTSLLDGIGDFFRDKDKDFFPIPVFQTRPDEGNSYGVMPVLLFSDKDTKAIRTILALIGQYNEHKKFSAAAAGYFFPNPTTNPDQVFDYYFEYAQKFYREAGVHYWNPHFQDKFFIEGNLLYMQTPFARFFGYGPATADTDESDYLFETIQAKINFGYYFLPTLRANLTERFVHGEIGTRAIASVADTLTTYGTLAGVRDSDDLIHRISLTYDTRPRGINSTKGTLLEAGFSTIIDGFASDSSMYGFSFEAVQLVPWWKERFVSVFRVALQDLYGDDIPMYLQSTLGGDKELRSYMPNRFVDNTKIIFSFEQRITVLKKNVFGIPVEFHADPFFELGEVCDHFGNFQFSELQPVGGIGLRGVVPPNVVGRLDIGIGKNGYNVYTQLGYPF